MWITNWGPGKTTICGIKKLKRQLYRNFRLLIAVDYCRDILGIDCKDKAPNFCQIERPAVESISWVRTDELLNMLWSESRGKK